MSHVSWRTSVADLLADHIAAMHCRDACAWLHLILDRWASFDARHTLGLGASNLHRARDRALRRARPGPSRRVAYGRRTGPDAVMISWKATGGLVSLHLPATRAAMNNSLT